MLDTMSGPEARRADRSHTKLDEPKLLMQGGFRIPFGRRPSQLVLGTQPLAQPSTSMSFSPETLLRNEFKLGPP